MARLTADQQSSFARGMRDSAAPTEYRGDEVELLFNGRPSRVGNSLSPRRGSKRLHPHAFLDEDDNALRGYGSREFATTARKLGIIAAVGSAWRVSEDQGATWGKVETDSTTLGVLDPDDGKRYLENLPQKPWSFVLMRLGGTTGTGVNAIIGANGGKPILWEGPGTKAKELTSWPTGTKFMAVFNDRLYGSAGGIHVYGSRVAVPGELSSGKGGIVVRAQSHDDDPEITGLWTHGVVLLVFKRRSVGYIEGFGYQTIQVQSGERGLSRSVGCIAYRSIAPAGDGGVCWLSDRGIEYMAPGTLAPQLVSSPIQGFMDEINWDAVRTEEALPTAMWWQSAEEYWLAVPTGGSSLNTHVIVFRPPGANRPPALWIHQQAQEGGWTLAVDNRGILEVKQDAGHSRAVLRGGILELNNLVGSFVEIDENGILQLIVPRGGMADMFAADRGVNDAIDPGEHLRDKPHSIGYDGFVRHMETGHLDDVHSDGSQGQAIISRIRSRPFVYGDVTRYKAPASVRVSALPTGTTDDIQVRLFGDGRQLQERTAHIVRAGAQRPRPDRIRMGGGKATAVQVELEFSGTIAVQAIEAAVRILDDTP